MRMVGKGETLGNQERVVNEYGDGVAWFRGAMIGKGGFGRVYLATLKNPRSRYSYYPPMMAVKSAEVSVSGSIQKEREVLSNVKGCPDIIKCFGEETTMGDNGAMVYNLLLEYGSGGTLADRIKKSSDKGLGEAEVKVFARCILRGLSHIHTLGYVHCDLKPDNILLVPNSKGGAEFRAKIGDFGLAKRVKQSKKRKLEAYWQGTPLYLSPEAVIDGVQEPPSDIWAFGCIVLEMLTGKSPWDAARKEMDADEILAKIRAGRELPKISCWLSKEAKDFLKVCFVRTPMYRLTADMLLNHPFVEGLKDCDEADEVEEVEDVNEIESILLVSESDYDDDEFSSGSYYWSDEGVEDLEDETVSSLVENGGSEAESFSGVTGSTTEVAVDQSNGRSRRVKSRVSSESRQQYPVSFTIPAGIC